MDFASTEVSTMSGNYTSGKKTDMQRILQFIPELARAAMLDMVS